MAHIKDSLIQYAGSATGSYGVDVLGDYVNFTNVEVKWGRAGLHFANGANGNVVSGGSWIHDN